jgi:hypothetical protein
MFFAVWRHQFFIFLLCESHNIPKNTHKSQALIFPRLKKGVGFPACCFISYMTWREIALKACRLPVISTTG